MVWVWEEPGEGLQLNQLYNDTFDLEVNFWSIVKFTSTTTGSTGTSIGGTGGGGGGGGGEEKQHALAYHLH